MKKVTIFLFVGILMAGFWFNPVFVMAKSTCYVDKDADDDGDGSKEEPYKKISKALDKGCKKIVVDKGTYKDSITLGKGVKIEGKSRDGVVIKGKVTMKDGSEINKVTVSGEGIDIDKNADAKVDNSKIKDAHIGIETLGNGKLTVEDTSFSGNRKALYLQRGKNVKITGCKVYNNSEEGIDIRSNVDGVISHNEIYSNGESGIEVILGKSDLRIENNSIKKNRASGIAAQYYKHASKVGGVKIVGNTITGNKDYGINCKIPSGGSPAIDYWTNSMTMHSNKIADNKDGNFAETCHFDEDLTSNANKTKEQVEQEQKELEEKKKKEEQLALEKVQEEEEAKAKQEEEKKKQQEEELRKQQQILTEIKGSIEASLALEEQLQKQQQKLEQRPEWVVKIIGPDFTLLGELSSLSEQHSQQIAKTKEQLTQLSDEEQKQQLENKINNLEQKQQEINTQIQTYNEMPSLYKWLLETFSW